MRIVSLNNLPGGDAARVMDTLKEKLIRNAYSLPFRFGPLKGYWYPAVNLIILNEAIGTDAPLREFAADKQYRDSQVIAPNVAYHIEEGWKEIYCPTSPQDFLAEFAFAQ